MTARQLSIAAIALCALGLSAELASQAAAPGQQAPPRDTTQPALTGTGRIRGRVLAAGGNAPVRRAQLTLQLSDNRQFGRLINTDAQGRYEFTGLPAGRFSLRASKPGYVGLQYGQRQPYEQGTSIALAAGETITSIDFALPRGAVIAGRITDEFGEVMPQVRVEVQRFQYGSDGQRRLGNAGTDTTDDRGEFRVYGLMPGEYIVNATVLARVVASTTSPGVGTEQDSPVDGYPPTFYPGTPNADAAQPITIGIGQEVGIQFGLRASRLLRISGTVRDSEGRPATAEVMLLSRQGGSLANSRTAADGSFLLNGVVAGDYSLGVRQTLRSPGVFEVASVPITVSGTDITGLSITTSKGAVISGRVTWEGTASETTPESNASPVVSPRVGATPTDLSAGWFADNDPEATGEVDANGNFRIGRVSGRVFVAMTAPPGWSVRSITLDGQDVTDKPLDVTGGQNIDGVRITMTDRLANVSGQVTDTRGSAVRQYVVVVQPTDEVEPSVVTRYVRTVRPDTNGRFELRNLRPGRYAATAIESMEPNRHYSPEFRRQLRRGAREFTLREGETMALDLRLTPGL